MADKNRIIRDGETVPVFDFGGIPLAVLADLPEGARVMFQNNTTKVGDLNTMIVPGLMLTPGAMVVVLPAEVAAKVRPGLRMIDKGNLNRSGVAH